MVWAEYITHIDRKMKQNPGLTIMAYETGNAHAEFAPTLSVELEQHGSHGSQLLTLQTA